MGFITFFLLKKLLNKGNAFIWNSKEKNIKAIKKINTIDLKLIVGVEKQKKILLKNTENFAIGNFTNNALLWGTRGNGKSTLIKSVFLKLSQKYTSLKLIQLNKNNIFDIEKIYPILSELPNMRFIIFIQDSFGPYDRSKNCKTLMLFDHSLSDGLICCHMLCFHMARQVVFTKINLFILCFLSI